MLMIKHFSIISKRNFAILMDKFVVRKRSKASTESKQSDEAPIEEEEKKSPKKVPPTIQPNQEEVKEGFPSYDEFESQMHPSWINVLRPWLDTGKLRKLHTWLTTEYATTACRPPPHEIFTAFRLTPFDSIKVVVVGQDPYPAPNDAMGLSFSVHRGIKVPGSLRNIYKCLQTDSSLNFKPPKHGDLTRWAEQGVFMLNAVLTVRQGAPNSHAKKGWEEFTDEVIKAINKERSGVVFMLWGAFAQAKAQGVNRSKHFILEACHPSPLSASKGGFFTCRHFSRANEYLRSNGASEIDWNLE
ncbi:unnamed protein product [Blepharisma stoltei]|uniref:Uracil-DNA glycosylase n=1 Tax=Blepharisma stoltei TaxID=1481888 RepID=A0AAU9JFX5_9CILI|nr:unnamed protein product [Blepharisma stoltei]